MIGKSSTRRLATATGIAAIALLGTTGLATASAAEVAPATNSSSTAVRTPELLTCFVSALGTPVYQRIGGPEVFRVNQGQGFNAYGSSGPWRYGKLWGDNNNIWWIHSNYLRAGTSHPSGPPCNP